MFPSRSCPDFFLRFILLNYCLGNSRIKDGIMFHNGVSHIAWSVFKRVKNRITLTPMFRQRQTSSFTLELLQVIKLSKCVLHVIRQEKRYKQTRTLKAQFSKKSSCHLITQLSFLGVIWFCVWFLWSISFYLNILNLKIKYSKVL